MIKELSKDFVGLIFKDYPTLEELNLSSNGKPIRITKQFPVEIEVVQNLDVFSKTLTQLNLSGNQISSLVQQNPPIGINNMVGVSLLVNLTELNLSNNRIIVLDGLESLAALAKLDVSKNLISSVTEVAKLGVNKELKQLSLAGNPIANRR